MIVTKQIANFIKEMSDFKNTLENISVKLILKVYSTQSKVTIGIIFKLWLYKRKLYPTVVTETTASHLTFSLDILGRVWFSNRYKALNTTPTAKRRVFNSKSGGIWLISYMLAIPPNCASTVDVAAATPTKYLILFIPVSSLELEDSKIDNRSHCVSFSAAIICKSANEKW